MKMKFVSGIDFGRESVKLRFKSIIGTSGAYIATLTHGPIPITSLFWLLRANKYR